MEQMELNLGESEMRLPPQLAFDLSLVEQDGTVFSRPINYATVRNLVVS